jgi:hypothetical protein
MLLATSLVTAINSVGGTTRATSPRRELRSHQLCDRSGIDLGRPHRQPDRATVRRPRRRRIAPDGRIELNSKQCASHTGRQSRTHQSAPARLSRQRWEGESGAMRGGTCRWSPTTASKGFILTGKLAQIEPGAEGVTFAHHHDAADRTRPNGGVQAHPRLLRVRLPRGHSSCVDGPR